MEKKMGNDNGKMGAVIMNQEGLSTDSSPQVVIIGGGIAAQSAAEVIRDRNPGAAITMFSAEAVRPYFRPKLSDYLSEDLNDEALYIHDEAWYRERNIELRLSSQVEAIDITASMLSLVGGECWPYDKLIIATGARSQLPSFPGVDLAGVFALRDLADARELKAAMSNAKRAVVIGGGVLGLEAAWEMASEGIEVSVVEFMPRIMPRQLDETSSLRLQSLIEAKGIKLYMGVSTEEIQGKTGITGVKISSGEILQADLVLLSTGVKPNIELAQASGIDVGRGIIVDEVMQTSALNVYAAGDVAEYRGNVIGLWPVALAMGRVAGAAAMGALVEYKQPELSTMLIAFDTVLFSKGEVNEDPSVLKITEIQDPVNDYYQRSFEKDGLLIGEITFGHRVSSSISGPATNVAANYWKCTVCGYIHEGSGPPESCPVCGAGRELFVAVDSEGKEVGFMTWGCTVCGYEHEGAEPPEECPVCGAPKEVFEAV